MQTVSSASSTCFRLLSAVECTATVLMPSSRHARRMRSAISPRLAITILSSMFGGSLDHEQRLSEFHRIAVRSHDRRHLAGLVALDLVHHFHGFDDAEDLAFLDLGADLDEGLGARRSRGIEGADHGR